MPLDEHPHHRGGRLHAEVPGRASGGAMRPLGEQCAKRDDVLG